MIFPHEQREIERLTRKVKKAAVAAISHVGFPSEDKESIAYAAAEAFQKELTRVLNSYGSGPRR